MKESRNLELSLKIFPDEVLRQVCKPVEKFNAALYDLMREMFVLMRAKEGIGLAAPQVGITKQLFVCEIEKESLGLINPVIIHANCQAEMIEGCLSLPDVQVNVTRNEHIAVLGFDIRGRKTQYELTGLWARVVQHEMDHLNGVLICDHGENVHTEKAQSGKKDPVDFLKKRTGSA